MCHDCACGLLVHPPTPGVRRLALGQRLLAHNDHQASLNRRRLRDAGVRAVNLLSSPGSGKTALLETLARHWQPAGAGAACAPACAALVGDLATDHDAQRLRRAGLVSVALGTGQACHLDAAMVARGLDALEAGGLPLADLQLLLIENVGNLVCPAAYDLGESQRVVLLAVGEGEDKPLKYPALFHSADVVVISKVDLAEPVGFQRSQAMANLAAVAPRAVVVEFSARTGEGLAALLAELVSPPVAPAPLCAQSLVSGS
jgi:hydrogenase nickel incorporation protein HypB